MKKVVKFGGSSLADAGQFRKVAAIVLEEESRRYVVPSAPGKRHSNDDKVTDLLIACHKAAQEGGADAISLINTLTGMKIDINRRTFAVANKTGGLSGPAIRPVAVRMVYQAAQAVKVPIIGMGGICNADDALEFILAGATAVAIGTANFHDPYATVKTVDGIKAYMEKYGIEDINELIGAVK